MPVRILPHDIWTAVADYLPDEVLFGLRTLNRTLRDVAEASIYRCLTIDNWNQKTECKLQGIIDANVGGFVREVRLYPGKISFPEESAVAKSPKRFSFGRRHSYDTVEQKTQKYVRLLTDTLRALPQVMKYHLECEDDTQKEAMLFPFIEPLLCHTAFGFNLRCLSLKLPPDKLSKLARVALPNLTELKCHFITGDMPLDQIAHKLEGFIIFVNNLNRSLCSLELTSTMATSSCFDMALFLDRLGIFPFLSSFCISIPFDGSHISDPAVLAGFLRKHHRSLDKIRLGAEPMSIGFPFTNPDSKIWMRRMSECLGGDCTFSLRTFETALRPLKADLRPLHHCIQRLSATLVSLTLTDRSLTFGEVQQLLNHTNLSSLKRLGIRVHKLTPSLMDLFADRLPSLRTLELNVSDVGMQDGEEHWSDAVWCFTNHMAPRRYPAWQLSELALTESRSLHTPWLETLEKVFIECIPGIRIRELPRSD